MLNNKIIFLLILIQFIQNQYIKFIFKLEEITSNSYIEKRFKNNIKTELQIGSPVFFRCAGQILFGTLVKFGRNKKGELRYNIVPSVKYKENGIELRRNYNISDKNVFLTKFKNKD